MKITFIKNENVDQHKSTIRVFVKDIVGNYIQIDLKAGEFVFSETDYITNSVRIYLKRNIIKIEDIPKAEGLDYYVGYRNGELENLNIIGENNVLENKEKILDLLSDIEGTTEAQTETPSIEEIEDANETIIDLDVSYSASTFIETEEIFNTFMVDDVNIIKQPEQLNTEVDEVDEKIDEKIDEVDENLNNIESPVLEDKVKSFSVNKIIEKEKEKITIAEEIKEKSIEKEIITEDGAKKIEKSKKKAKVGRPKKAKIGRPKKAKIGRPKAKKSPGRPKKAKIGRPKVKKSPGRPKKKK